MIWISHHPKPLAALAVVMLAVAFFSVQTQGSELSEETLLDVLGGTMPCVVMNRLDHINNEIQNAKSILHVHSNRIHILNAENEIRVFTYAYGALWVDGQPVLKNVEGFHFEYRDAYGNLLTRAERRIHQIELISYLFSVKHRSKPVLGSARIPVKMVAQTQYATL